MTTPARALPGADLCVHCGFCLQACPTYLILDDENDSPRGRIVLMKSLEAGGFATGDGALAEHLDRCLGCRACESACPSGVPYGELLEATRTRTIAARPLPFVSALVLWVFARPWALRVAMVGGRVARALGISRLLAKVPGSLGIAMANLEATRRPASIAHAVPVADGDPVAILEGCVMEGLFAPVNRATESVLAHNEYRVVAAPGQGCCGSLHEHAGDRGAAQRLARTNIDAFERSGARWIAVNSAGCGAAMKAYGHLLGDDPLWRDRATAFAAKVRDVSELLAGAGPKPAPAPGMRVAVDHPCHLLHGQRLSGPPARVLDAMSGLACAELPDAATCCGSAGLYALAQPELSQRVLAPKLASIAASGADVVATGNPGCLMHIRAGLLRAGSRVETRHPVELLAEAYARQAAGR